MALIQFTKNHTDHSTDKGYQYMTKGLDLTTDAAALCPSCGARTKGAKFCPECGKPLHPKTECSHCGTKFDAGTKFCPECGQKV